MVENKNTFLNNLIKNLGYYWSIITEVGTQPIFTKWENRLISALNQGSILSSLFLLSVTIANVILTSDWTTFLLMLFASLAYLPPILLNHYRLYVLAKLWFIGWFTSVVILWCILIYPTPYYLLIPFTCSLLLASKTISKILSLPIFLGIFIWLKWMIAPTPPTNESYLYDFYLLAGIYIFILYVLSTINHYANRVEKLLKEVNQKNEALERQYTLQKSEQFFRSIFENNQLSMVVIDKNQKINRTNNAFSQLLAYSTTELNQLLLSDLLSDNETFNDNFELLKDGAISHFEFEGNFKKKHTNDKIAVVAHITGLYNERNEFIEGIATMRDVTDLNTTRKALEQSHQRLSTIIENAPIGIAIREIGSPNYLLSNKKFAEILQYDPQQVVGLNRETVLHEENKTALNEGIQKLLNGEIKSFSNQKIFKRSDNTLIYCDVVRAMVEIDGKPTLVGMLNDITDKVQLEKERKERYQQQQQIFDSMPVLFAYLDKKNRIVRINELAVKLSDKNIKNLEGQHCKEVFPFLTDADIKKNSYVMRTGKSLLGDVLEISLPRMPKMWVQIDRLPMTNQKGEIIGLLKFGTNITHLKYVESELRQKNDALKSYIDSNLQLENFAYIASHDMKEPLRTIHGFTQLLDRKLKPYQNDTIQTYFQYITGGVKRMQHLIEDLLEYSRVTQVSSDVEKETINLNETILKVKDNLKQSIQERQVILQIENLPSIFGYEYQMIQLFQNLISNAIKFQNSEQPHIQIHTSETSTHFQFSIQDNGIGIADEYINKIFLIFKKLHRNEVYQGTGIGLATCKKIVENHNGRIWVESKVGVGSTFYFTIEK